MAADELGGHVQDAAGKTAVITGAASGIGRAMADRFAAEGMHVVLADIEPEPLTRAAEELQRDGHEVLAVPTDVSSGDSVEALAAAAIERFGDVHLVANNAGVAPPGGILEMPLATWRWVMDVNLFGVLHGIRAFLPAMIERGDGHIVNTASVAGLLPQPGQGAYNVSKHGVVVLSEALVYELELMGAPIGVTVVCPAWVPTRIFESDRNAPDGVTAAEGPVTDRVREVAAGLVGRSRRTAADIADATWEAVLADRFYVVTHPGILPFVKRRHEDIELQRNPSVDQGF